MPIFQTSVGIGPVTSTAPKQWWSELGAKTASAGSAPPPINAILTEDANTPPTGPNDPITTESGNRLITEDS